MTLDQTLPIDVLRKVVYKLHDIGALRTLAAIQQCNKELYLEVNPVLYREFDVVKLHKVPLNHHDQFSDRTRTSFSHVQRVFLTVPNPPRYGGTASKETSKQCQCIKTECLRDPASSICPNAHTLVIREEEVDQTSHNRRRSDISLRAHMPLDGTPLYDDAPNSGPDFIPISAIIRPRNLIKNAPISLLCYRTPGRPPADESGGLQPYVNNVVLNPATMDLPEVSSHFKSHFIVQFDENTSPFGCPGGICKHFLQEQDQWRCSRGREDPYERQAKAACPVSTIWAGTIYMVYQSLWSSKVGQPRYKSTVGSGRSKPIQTLEFWDETATREQLEDFQRVVIRTFLDRSHNISKHAFIRAPLAERKGDGDEGEIIGIRGLTFKQGWWESSARWKGEQRLVQTLKAAKTAGAGSALAAEHDGHPVPTGVTRPLSPLDEENRRVRARKAEN